jgi:hypothetical protein
MIVVDGMYPDRFSDAEAELLRAYADNGAVRAALTVHRIARAHDALVSRLVREAAAPVVTLPFVFTTELGAAEYGQLGRRLLSAPAVRRARVREGGDHALQAPPAGLSHGIV